MDVEQGLDTVFRLSYISQDLERSSAYDRYGTLGEQISVITYCEIEKNVLVILDSWEMRNRRVHVTIIERQLQIYCECRDEWKVASAMLLT
jgi:hypothetical protein